MGRPKLTREMAGQAVRLKTDGLSNGDTICALGMRESTFCRWVGEPKNRLQRELREGLRKEETEFKYALLNDDPLGGARPQPVLDRGGDGVPKIVLGVAAQPVQERLDFSAPAEGEGPRGSSRPCGSEAGGAS